MFNSVIIDTAIGIVFIYLLLSLLCSAVAEGIESFMRNRATDLERGIRELITEQDSVGGLKSLARRIWPALGHPTDSPPTDPLTGTSPPEREDFVALLYNHALISGLFKGTYKEAVQFRTQAVIQRFRQWLMTGSPKLPTYIPSRNFALAVLDLAAPKDSATGSPPSTSIDDLRNAIVGEGRIPADSKLGKALLTLIDAAGNDFNKARQNIENWYDSAMDRVSGWYKRRTQFIIFAIGFFVAIAVNADTVVIVKKLATDKALRDSVSAAAVEYAKANATASPTPTPSPTVTPTPSPLPSPTPSPLPGCGPGKEDTPQCKYNKTESQLASLGLPIGWDTPGNQHAGQSAEDERLRTWPGLHFWDKNFWDNWRIQFRIHFLGWLLTALAVSMGAPFWFDLLNKFIVIRSTVKPKEKSPEEKSKD